MITTQDHFIQKKVVLYRCHFLADIVKAPKPHIRLLCNRRIEIELSIGIQQLRIGSHVTLLTTEGVVGLVFRPVMKGIYTHAHPMKKLNASALNFVKCITV
jgi:hypothetical protein